MAQDASRRIPRKLARVAVVMAILLGLYAAAGFLLAPWLAQRHLPDLLGQRLGRAVEAAEIRVNPFLFTVEARKARVQGHHGRPLLAVERLFADLSLAGLVRQAWVLDALVVDGLELHLVLQADGSSNLADVAAQWNARSAPSGGEGPALALERLALSDAYVHVSRLGGADAVQATFGPLGGQAHDLSTKDGEAPGTYQLTAALPQGAVLASRGSVDPGRGMSADGQVTVRALRAGSIWPLLPAAMPVSSLQALVDLSARYAWGPDAFRLADVGIEATDVIAVRAGGQQPALKAARVVARGGSVDLGQRKVHLGELLVAQGASHLVVAGNEPEAAAPVERRAPPAPAPAAASGWGVEIGTLRVEEVDLALEAPSTALRLDVSALSGHLRLEAGSGAEDRVLATGVHAQWREATLQMPQSQLPRLTVGATTLERGAFDLAQRTLAGGLLRVEKGSVSVLGSPAVAQRAGPQGPAAAPRPWSLLLERLELAGLGGSYAVDGEGRPALLRVESLDAGLRLEATWGGATPQVLATGLQAELRDAVLSDPGTQGPALRLATARVVQGRLDLAQRSARAAKLVLQGAARVVREPGGAVRLGALGSTQPDASAPPGGAASPWRWGIDLLEVPSMTLDVVDRGSAPALRLQGTLRAEARDVGSATTTSFDAKVALAGGGSLAAAGTAAPGGRQVRAQVQASGIALVPLQPLLRRFAALQAQSGTVSASADVAYGPGQQPFSARGRVGVADLVLTEAGSGRPFLSWKQMDAQGVALDLGARSVSVKDIDVQQPGMTVVVSEDRKVNLLQVLSPDEGATSAARPKGEASERFRYEIDRVRLRDGEVDFSDHSLVLPFATTVQGLQGTIVGISNDPARRASVQASGAIEPYGSARVEGTLLPADPGQFTDLQVRFENVRVPPLSPYTATFAGRKVEAGKLWLDLEYRVEDGALRGSNDIRLADFRLGERVEAAGAMDVPLDLVIGLLTDADGEIRLSVPVTGALGDAQFSVGSAVRQAVANVLQRIVTAPFRALGKLFGGSSDALARIEFLPGSARLRPEEREKLDALTQGLRERPRLQLVVTAPYDEQLDAAAMRQARAGRALAEALGRRVAPGEEPGPFAFDDPATARALERLVREAAGNEAVRTPAQQPGATGEPGGAKRTEALMQQLADAQVIDDGAIRLLAVDRSRRIADALQAQGVERSRVTTGGLAIVRPNAQGEIASQLQLAAAAAPG